MPVLPCLPLPFTPKAGIPFRECMLSFSPCLVTLRDGGHTTIPHWWDCTVSMGRGILASDGSTTETHVFTPGQFFHTQVPFYRVPPLRGLSVPLHCSSGLTSVCTRLTLWARSSRTQLKMSTTPSFSAMSSMVSMAMKQPVLPAPALEERTVVCVCQRCWGRASPGEAPHIQPRGPRRGHAEQSESQCCKRP